MGHVFRRPPGKLGRPLAITLVLVLSWAGCIGYKASSIAPPTPGAMPAWLTQGGISIGADPYTDPERQKAAFDADFGEERILAIQVFVKNGGDAPVILRRSDITLALPDGRGIAPAPADMVAARLHSAGKVLALTLGFGVVGAVAGTQAASAEHQSRRADYVWKELAAESRLLKDQSRHGFVYFMPPRGTPPFAEATLMVRLIDPQQRAVIPVSLPLTGLGFRGAKTDESQTPASPTGER